MAKKKQKTAAITNISSSSLEKQKNTVETQKKCMEWSFPLSLITTNPPKVFEMSSWTELYPGRVWVITNFFSLQECQEWIRFCESNTNGGFLEYTAHPASKYIAHRECFRMQQSNAYELANRLYQRMKYPNNPHSILSRLQQEVSNEKLYPNNHVPIGCNPNLRFYKYLKGHSFGKHIDESNMVSVCSASNYSDITTNNNHGNIMISGKTEVTVLIYLSSCQGGATRFYEPHQGRRKGKATSSFAFDPQPGAMLLHVHGDYCLEHEADPVMNGVKYVLRTDIVFGQEK